MRERVLTLNTRTVVVPSAAGTRPCSMANGPTPASMLPQLGRVSTERCPTPDLGEQVVDVAVRAGSDGETMATLLVSVLPPPTPSTCSRSDAPMAPISASSRATLVGGQPLAQEERAAGGAAPHQDAGHDAVPSVLGHHWSRSSTRSTITPDWPR